MLSRPVTAAGFAAVIFGPMLAPHAAALQLVSADKSSCQATPGLAWVQVSYAASPQKKGGARGKAGTGAHAAMAHPEVDIILQAAAAQKKAVGCQTMQRLQARGELLAAAAVVGKVTSWVTVVLLQLRLRDRQLWS